MSALDQAKLALEESLKEAAELLRLVDAEPKNLRAQDDLVTVTRRVGCCGLAIQRELAKQVH